MRYIQVNDCQLIVLRLSACAIEIVSNYSHYLVIQLKNPKVSWRDVAHITCRETINFVPGMEVEVFVELFELLPQRAIFWKKEKMLLLADMHLGKVNHFRRSGIPAPLK